MPDHENVWGSGGIIPCLLMPQMEVGCQLHSLVTLSPGENSSQSLSRYQRYLNRLQCQSGRFEADKNILLLLVTTRQFFCLSSLYPSHATDFDILAAPYAAQNIQISTIPYV